MFDLLLSLQPSALHLAQLVTPYLPLFEVLSSVATAIGVVVAVVETIHHW